MPDSEHPDVGDASDVAGRPGDDSPGAPRRSRTSTADRPGRSRLRSSASDPRTEGSRTPPRRAKPRPVAADDDVAAALARVPDAGSNGNGNGSHGANGAHADNGDGRRVGDPGLVVAGDLVGGAMAAEAVTTPAQPPVEDTATDDERTEPVDTVTDRPDTVTEPVDTVTDHLDTVTDRSDTVTEPGDVSDAPTQVVPAVDDRAAPDSTPVTSPIPVEEQEILPHQPEVAPRIYDVEADEPGAYRTLVPAVTEQVDLQTEPATSAEPEPEAELEPEPPRRRLRRRPRVRRVTRVIRHVDTWTVFKVLALVNLVIYAAALISGVLLWNVAHGTGTVDNVERFMESFGWETFTFNGKEIFDAVWRIGLFVALGMTGLGVLAATTFNLITDLVGGIRVTVLEEEVVVAPPEPHR